MGMSLSQKNQQILNNKDSWQNLEPQALLQNVMKELGSTVIQANSLGLEDVAIMHMMHQIDPNFASFTLDTGRLNPETLQVLGRLQEKYKLNIKILFPDAGEVQSMVESKGINLFYESIENRKLCCQVRKINPMEKVLPEYQAWVCGLRKEQSVTRNALEKIDQDPSHPHMLKISPLADWSLEQVKAYVQKQGIPYNSLFDQGYKSIGCAPCSRAVQDGQDERAGRWWWENPDQKECGLHQIKS